MSESEFNLRKYGAAGDGSTNDSPAIQAAIDACHAAGGGIVTVPRGDYRIGTTELKTGVCLRLEAGATLWASKEAGDYLEEPDAPYSCRILFRAACAERIGFAGEGQIRGFGTETFGSWWGVPTPPPLRVCTIFFDRCKDIDIRGITIRDSSFWTIHLKRCDTVYIQRVNIHNFRYHLNADGIDPDGSRNVYISYCHLSTGDDSIVLKSTSGSSCENIFVTDCVLESPCTAIKLGTESFGDFRNIHFSRCKIVNSAIGIGLFMKDGGTMERIRFSDITIENADLYDKKPVMPIFADIEKRHADSAVGTIRDVEFADMTISTRSSVLLQGMPDSRISQIQLRNVRLRIVGVHPFNGRVKPVTGRRTYRDDRDTKFMSKPAYVALAYCKDATVYNVNIVVPDEVAVEYPRYALYGYAADMRAERIRQSATKEEALILMEEEEGELSC